MKTRRRNKLDNDRKCRGIANQKYTNKLNDGRLTM